MNDNRPQPEHSPRAVERLLRQVMGVMPVVVVMGARQAGKSTLARMIEAGTRPYLTLDELDVLLAARDDPSSLVRRAPRLTLDEVQRVPDLLLEIKRVVDDGPRNPGQFLLTGSANLLLMERVSESLAGRAYYLTLWPMTRREVIGLGSSGIWSELLSTPVEAWYDLVRNQIVQRDDWRVLVRRGGFPVPALHLSSDSDRAVWFRAYIQTYLERDLQTLASIDALSDFRRLMQAASLRIGQVINQAEIARDISIPRPTAHRYLNLLETSYQIVRIEPYSVNRTKRLIKSPKLYWNDSALALAVANDPEPSGSHLENLIACDLLAWRDLQSQRPGVFFWRTVEGKEVDFVIEHGRELLPIEVRATRRPTHYDAAPLQLFASEYGTAVRGALLLHDGEDVFWAASHVLAAPWWKVI